MPHWLCQWNIRVLLTDEEFQLFQYFHLYYWRRILYQAARKINAARKLWCCFGTKHSFLFPEKRTWIFLSFFLSLFLSFRVISTNEHISSWWFTWPFISRQTHFMLFFSSFLSAKHTNRTSLSRADMHVGAAVVRALASACQVRAALLLMAVTGQWRCVFKTCWQVTY